jgi:tripartite-type tricarboxylate transporter receptor subunit TctC
MSPPRVAAWLLAIATMMIGALAACAQNYPSKPIRVVTAAAGGGTDFAARVISAAVTADVGWQIIVDNRAGTNIAGELVAKAPPDGYTLLMMGNILWQVSLLEKTPYDVVQDFSPITLAVRNPSVLVVHPSLPVKSVKELIALAKAHPGALNYSTSGTGAPNHLAAELFKSMAKISMVRVNYKGGGPAVNDLLGGQVQLTFGNIVTVTPHVKAGRLRALAVTSAQRSALYPDLPTVAASGLPGYESTTVFSFLAPAKTPAPVINQLNHEIVLVLNKPDLKEKLLPAGLEIVGSSPEQLGSAMKTELVTLGKVVKDAGIRAE